MNDPKLSKQMPGVAAVVNGSKVLKNQVAEECITRFGKKMLDVEITRSLLVQALENSGAAVDQEDLNQEIDRAATAAGFADSEGKVAVASYLAKVTNNDASKIDFYIEDQVWPSVALKTLVEDRVEVSEEDMQKPPNTLASWLINIRSNRPPRTTTEKFHRSNDSVAKPNLRKRHLVFPRANAPRSSKLANIGRFIQRSAILMPSKKSFTPTS